MPSLSRLHAEFYSSCSRSHTEPRELHTETCSSCSRSHAEPLEVTCREFTRRDQYIPLEVTYRAPRSYVSRPFAFRSGSLAGPPEATCRNHYCFRLRSHAVPLSHAELLDVIIRDCFAPLKSHAELLESHARLILHAEFLIFPSRSHADMLEVTY